MNITLDWINNTYNKDIITMGSVKKVFKKVVGAVTGKSSAKAPKIEVARKGKRGLRIDLNSSAGGSRGGLNIV